MDKKTVSCEDSKISIGQNISTVYYKNCHFCEKQNFTIIDIKEVRTSSKLKEYVFLQCKTCGKVMRIEYKPLLSYLRKCYKEENIKNRANYYDSDKLKETDALRIRVTGSFGSGKRR